MPTINYFLFVDGLSGPEQIARLDGGFRVSEFNLDGTNGFDALMRLATTPYLTDLEVYGAFGSTLAPLVDRMLKQEVLSSVRLIGVDMATEQIVEDLLIGDVSISKVTSNATNAPGVHFDFDKYKLTTTEETADDSRGVSRTTEFDFRTGLPEATISSPSAPLDGNIHFDFAPRYFLTIDGVTGTNLGGLSGNPAGAPGSFELNDFQYTISHEGDPARPVFTDIELAFDLGSAVAEVLAVMTRGDFFPSIRIEGLGSTGQEFFTLDLGHVIFSELNDTNHESSVKVVYEQMSLTTASRDRNGEPVNPQTATFDRASQTDVVDIPEPRLGPDDLGGRDGLTYYLLIDGILSDETRTNAVGGFELEGFEFDAGVTIGIYNGSPRPDRVNIAPVSGEANFGQFSVDLFRSVATQTSVGTVQIVGLDSNGDVYYDLLLANAHFSDVEQTQGAATRFDLVFSEVELETFTYEQESGPLFDGMFSFNLVENSQSTSIAGLGARSAGERLSDIAEYVILIDGIEGVYSRGVIEGAFQVTGLRFDVSVDNPMALGVTGRSGTGSNFSPLIVNFEALQQTPLFQALAVDQPTTVQLLGLTADGTVVSDVRLGGASLTKLTSGSESSIEVEFDFYEIEMQERGQSEAGDLEPIRNFGFDLEANTSGASVSPVWHTGTGAPVYPAKFYLEIDGVGGTSVDEGLTDTIRILDFGMEYTGGLTRPEFSGVTIEAVLGDAVVPLLEAMVRQDTLGNVRIVGIQQVGDSPGAPGELVYDLRLQNAFLTSLKDTDWTSEITLDFGAIDVRTYEPSVDGAFVEAASFQWDLAAHDTGGALPEADGFTREGYSGVARNYVLLVEGITNDDPRAVLDEAFDLNGFMFDASAAISLIGSGGASRTSFEDLVLAFDSNAAAADFADALLTVGRIPSIQILGLNPTFGDNPPTIVQDYRFGGVYVVAVDDGTDAKSVTVAFEELQIITQRVDGYGEPIGDPDSMSWDLLTNNFGDGVSPVGEGVVSPPLRLVADSVTGNEDSDITGNVLSNDTGGAGALFATLGQDASHGSVALNSDGSFTYTPDADFNGSDQFTYWASDGAATETATVNVTVSAVNDAPDATDGAAQVTEDGSVSIDLGALVIDVDGDSLTPRIVSGPSNGVLSAQGGFSYLYAPSSDFNGVDRFVFAVADGSDASSSASVEITVSAVNDAPSVSGDTAGAVQEDRVLEVSGKLTATDPDSDESGFRPATVSGTYGSLSIAADGAWTYSLANADASVQALATGDAVVDRITVLTVDGTEASIAIDVTGLDEALGRVTVREGTPGDDDILLGRLGNVVYAGAGDDTVRTGNGGDTAYGGSGDDRLMGNNGPDQLYGGRGNDILRGGNGRDTLEGGAGEDLLFGGRGKDTLTGGADADIFVFDHGWGRDFVTDFEVGVDHIGLRHLNPSGIEIRDTDDGALLIGPGNSMLLEGVSASDITDDDFVFL